MRTVCAWCSPRTRVSASPNGAEAPASHGMCRPCLDRHLAALSVPARERSAFAPAGLFASARGSLRAGLAFQGA